MKRPMCATLVIVFLISSIPAFSFAAGSEAQAPQFRTVWENPYTLTTYHPSDEVNSTFYTFPKVIWNGSQYVDCVFNSSDMSAGIGSVYMKVCPDHTVFYDPYQSEEVIKSEAWMVEDYDASSSTWQADNPVDDSVHCLVNSSGIYFDRTTMLGSGATLDEWYWLRIGSKLTVSVMLSPAQSGEYRLTWILDGVSGTTAKYLAVTQNVTSQFVEDQSCSSVQFLGENESKCLVDWSDAVFFNSTSERWETCFRELELQKDASDDRCRATISFVSFLLAQGESVILDPTINTFNSTPASDGYIEKFGDSYPPANWTLVDISSDILMVGQNYAPTYYGSPYYYYYQYRSYVSFDTFAIPALAYNISPTLELKTCDDNSLQDFYVQVLGGVQPIYNNNFTAASWGTGTTQVSSWNTNGYPGDYVYINFTVPADQINRYNSTEFELKCNKEGEAPYNREDIAFWSGDSAGNEPKLEASYCLDTENINGETWFYRNVSSSKVVIILFGAYAYPHEVGIRSIDWLGDPSHGDPPEKETGKLQFIDAMIANGFSVYTPSHSGPYGHVSWYESDSTWVQDLTLYLMYNLTYTQVYLFGFSGGGAVVGNEIQKDYASRFSAAVMNCAPVNWSGYSTDHLSNRCYRIQGKSGYVLPRERG